MIKKTLAIVLMAFTLASCGGNKVTVNDQTITLEPGIYAKLTTSMGDILFDFHEDLVPMTAGNFIALAEGTHPKVDAKYADKPYFDGTIFHRVIPKFMIQAGDPDGTGAGSPGYKFPQEISAELKHDKSGVVSMANAGPGTNGSQFFITHNATPHLDGGYNIFAQVISGQEIVVAIGDVERASQDRPVDIVLLQSVDIIRVGKDAKNWNAADEFLAGMDAVEQRKVDAAAALEAEMNDMYSVAKKTATGLRYIIEDIGSGVKPEIGQVVKVKYAGFLTDGTCFDTSDKEWAIKYGLYDGRREPYEAIPVEYGPNGRVIAGWKEGLELLNVGGKAKLIIPSNLGYGDQGAGGVIPPNATLIFDIEILEIAK